MLVPIQIAASTIATITTEVTLTDLRIYESVCSANTQWNSPIRIPKQIVQQPVVTKVSVLRTYGPAGTKDATTDIDASGGSIEVAAMEIETGPAKSLRSRIGIDPHPPISPITAAF